MNVEELKQITTDAHKELCHFYKKGKCSSPAIDDKKCDEKCEYMKEFLYRIAIEKVNLNEMSNRAYLSAIKREKINNNDSYSKQIKAIQQEVIELSNASNKGSEHLAKYSEIEEEVADVIISSLTLLEMIKTKDIGRLLTDKILFNENRL
jgi:NTP pyrophosphatase (non-canonical NTP hydrolase)